MVYRRSNLIKCSRCFLSYCSLAFRMKIYRITLLLTSNKLLQIANSIKCNRLLSPYESKASEMVKMMLVLHCIGTSG